MRGKAPQGLPHGAVFGITPAYAGKRYLSRIGDALMGDHPRLCGEKLCRQRGFRQNTGSPPPMRGKVRVGEAYSRAYRITPAYAGKRSSLFQFLFLSRDHPRLCGEKFLSALWKIFLTGSPPPMRGKAAETLTDSGCIGITPAYAGKSRAIPSRSRRFWDHPRLCGEKEYEEDNNPILLGSPPPMRGKAGEAWQKNNQSRITPAYAGKRPLKTVVKSRFWDHPRLCGEKFFQIKINRVFEGSPPPMRGKGF